jgi:uncharacterized membrane protein YidH (DUF202 family)
LSNRRVRFINKIYPLFDIEIKQSFTTEEKIPSGLQEHIHRAAAECIEKEKKANDIIEKIISSSKSNYAFKTKANTILIIIGVVLIANPVIYTWMRTTHMIDPMDDMDLTNLNYFLGGVGIVAFVTTFFNKPQKQMTTAIGDLAQLLFICMMFQVQFHTLLGRIEKDATDENSDANKCIQDTNEELYTITSRTVHLIDDCIKKYSGEQSKTKVADTEK